MRHIAPLTVARMLRYGIPALFALLLSGCLFDGLKLPETYRPVHRDASEPVEHLSVWHLAMEQDGKVAHAYVRFIRTTANTYVMEQYLSERETQGMYPFVVHFIPLGDDWYALHWRDIGGREQAYNLVRIQNGQFTVRGMKDQQETIRQLAVLADMQMASSSLELQGDIEEHKVIALLKTVAALPQESLNVMQPLPSVPGELQRSATKELSQLVSALDWDEISDSWQIASNIVYFSQLHQEGNGWGTYALARFIENGWGIPSDAGKANGLAKMAIARGVGHANQILGLNAYMGIGQPSDPSQAVAYFKLAAEAGEPRAFTMLSFAYRDGKGAPQDRAQAKFWLEQATNALRPDAYHLLAGILLDENTAASDLQAVQLLESGMARGQATAFYLRGWMHENGRGGPVDLGAATTSFIAAAERGDAYSQWLAGERLILGQGTESNRATGEHWIRQASLAGIAEASATARKRSLPDLTRFSTKPLGFMQTFRDESKDWGIATSHEPRKSPHALTPTVVPGARTIKTAELNQLLQERPDLLVIDVSAESTQPTVPGGYRIAEMATDPARLQAVLQRLSTGDLSQPVVFLCASVNCWLSYNAALYATQAGYSDVIWYRGGLESWFSSEFERRAPRALPW